MNISLTVAATALLSAFAGNFSPLAAQTKPPLPGAACAPMGGVSFVCGARNPEDLVPVPGTRWLISSGLEAGAGLKLIDTNARTARPFYTGELSQQHQDKKLFANCPGPPDPRRFSAHGIYLRRAGAPGHYMLYVVSHGELETIQVFEVDASSAEPSRAWMGCVPMPEGNKAYANLGDQANSRRLAANAVAAFSDGTIIATVPQRPGTTNKQRLSGEATGDVIEWKPGTDSFRVIPGTQLAGNNGIEISLDETEFYVVSFGTETIVAFSRQDALKPLRQSKAPGFMPDNLRWSGDRLIAAGPMHDEPACGGTRLAVVDSEELTRCHRGYMIAQLDPRTMAWTILAYSEPNPELAVVSTGVIIDNTLWIGAASADGVAYRPLPRVPTNAR